MSLLLSERARKSLDGMMEMGLRQGIAAHQPGAQICAVPEIAQATLTHMVLLSIASYSFRIITALHFAHDLRTRAWIADVIGTDDAAMGPQQFIDAIGEIGNMCCGTMNRELGSFHDDLGLSTPQILDIRSLPYMAQIGADHLQHFRVDLPGGLSLYATLCARAYAPLDFHWQMPEAQEAAGELELF